MDIAEPSEDEERGAAKDLAALTAAINNLDRPFHDREEDEIDGFVAVTEMALDFQIRGDRNLAIALWDANHEALAEFAAWLVSELDNREEYLDIGQAAAEARAERDVEQGW